MTAKYSGTLKAIANVYLPQAFLFVILCGYTYVANATPEEVKQRVTNDLKGKCKDIFLDKYYLTFGFVTLQDRAFAIGQYYSDQYCGWATKGKLSSSALDSAAINVCNASRPKGVGVAECEIYAHNNDIVYVSNHEKLKIAKELFDKGDPEANRAIAEVGEKDMTSLTFDEKGEYEYLVGKILSKSKTESDKISAIERFNVAWNKYGNINAALEEGNLRMSTGAIDKDWKSIRTAYEWYLATASSEEKLLHPEVALNLEQTDLYYQADLANQAEASRVKAQLDAIKAKREGTERAEQKRLEAIEADRKNRQLAIINKAETDRIAKEGDGSEDDATCKSYGAKLGSVGYINCRVQLRRTKQLADEQQAALKSKEIAAQKEQHLVDFNNNKKCAIETQNPACMTNAGYALYQDGNKEDAKGWFTLAARYGEPTAIKNLTSNGWPVPAADLLKQQQQTTDNTNATNALMLLLTGVNAYQQGKAAGYQAVPAPAYTPKLYPAPAPMPTPQMAPDGSFVSGGHSVTMCPDGSYVSGRCTMAPNGKYVGQ